MQKKLYIFNIINSIIDKFNLILVKLFCIFKKNELIEYR